MRSFFSKRREGADRDRSLREATVGVPPLRTPAGQPGDAGERRTIAALRPVPDAGPVLADGPGPRSRRASALVPSAPDEVPRFSMPIANGIRTTAPQAVGGISPEASRALREAFTPTRPKQEVNALFIGRLGTLRRVIAAIEEERAHVVLYGDRGRGKTSLANAVERIAVQAGYTTLKLTCSAELSFEDMFRGLLRRIPSTYHRAAAENPFSQTRNFSSFDERLPAGPFSVTQLADVLDEIGGTHVLMVLDEYDRVTAEDVKNKLAELIKNLTDMGTPVTLLIIGVAENVDQLLGKHPSIQRALVAVHLPPMSDREIDRIILAGAEAAGLTFAQDVRDRIVMLSKGLPYFAQLLSLHSARAAVARGRAQVERADLVEAVRRCAVEADRSVVEAYHRTLGREDRASGLEDVLYAAARAEVDEFGSFRPQDVAAFAGIDETHEDGGVRALPADLARLAEGEGAVLEWVIVPTGHRIRFRNQMMRQFVMLMQAERRNLL